jgi:aspartate aminotransferase-like enzyme
MSSPLVFKTATEDLEFELIHRLNYKTFVEEIPQHQPNPERRLVDKFHDQNTYLICLCDRKLIGMMAVRGDRPFSLDQKLADVDSYLPPGRKICEIRLLAVAKEYRAGQVLRGMLALLWQHGIEQGYNLAIISGTTRQAKLYQHLGFTPFGPLVGTGDAKFQPMYVTLETFESGAREFLRTAPCRTFQRNVANFLPGPVAIHREVREAFEQPPESHRSDLFITEFQATREKLCALTRARSVEIVLGSGTLANDVIGAQLSLERKPGLVLSNGEFGDRLIDAARRFKLDFEPIQFGWGEPLDLSLVKKHLQSFFRAPQWIWCPLSETSTGVLNDLSALKNLAEEFEIKLCLDAISAIGTMPVNLEGIYLASCASGKGLASYPGLGLVFYNQRIASSQKLPRYLDLGYYAEHKGIAFTQSSNLVYALGTAVDRMDWDAHFDELKTTSRWLRERLSSLGFDLVGKETLASPAVVTIALPREINSTKLGRQLNESGYLLSCNSEYLRRKNWIQICLMGEFSRAKLEALVNMLHRLCFTERDAFVAG